MHRQRNIGLLYPDIAATDQPVDLICMADLSLKDFVRPPTHETQPPMDASTANRFIAYYRVSTIRQGRSGLGLAAQQEAVRSHLKGTMPIAEFTEVESGRKNGRMQLSAALSACRLHRATLIIAKLDRLARNVAFVSHLMDAGVKFEAVDFPQANRLTIHILAAVPFSNSIGFKPLRTNNA